MKKTVAALMIVLAFMLTAGQIFAAALPKKMGPVQDRAALLTAEEKKLLKEQASGKTFQFYILTVANLNGLDGENYAADVFASWELTAKDALIVVSDKGSKASLHLTNRQLQSALGTKEKREELINKSYVPAAKEGKYADALTTLMVAMNAAADTGSAAAAANAAEEKLEDSGEQSSTYFEVLGMLLSMIAIVQFLFSITALTVLGLRLKSKLRRVQSDISGQMLLVQRTLEKLDPLTVMSQGKTNRLAAEVSRMLQELLVETQNLYKESGRSRFLLYTPGLQKALKHAIEASEELFGRVATRISQAEALMKEEFSVTQMVEQIRLDLPKVESKLKQLASKLNSTLDLQRRQLEEIERIFKNAEKDNTFDPLVALESAEKAREALDLLSGDLDELADYDQKIASFPEKEHASRQAVWKVVSEHHLTAIPYNPYLPIEESKEVVERMQHNLKSGNVFSLRSQWDQAERLLREAVSTVQRTADIKLNNRSKISKMDQRINRLHNSFDALKPQFERVALQYDRSLWHTLHQEYEQTARQLSGLGAQLDEAVRMNDDAVQQFDDANDRLDQAAEQMSAIEGRLQHYESTIEQWEQSYRATTERFDSDQRQYKQSVAFLQSGQLVIPHQRFLEVDEIVAAFVQYYRDAANKKPTDLLQLRKHEQDHHEAVIAFVDLIHNLDNYRGEAEQVFAQLRQAFEYEFRHTSGMKYRRDLQQNYRYLTDQVQECLANGQYDQAFELLAQMQQLIGSLQSVNLERRVTGGVHYNLTYRQQELYNQFNSAMNHRNRR
ncbi:TPM domain-containing protein [Paenibacillus sp. GCM10027626]|uniref:TPM domain-containing protein n=1 Tax=Paenibacillus sp. GCM10027626 TaxID=3273411 RepID=UPI0036288D4F